MPWSQISHCINSCKYNAGAGHSRRLLSFQYPCSSLIYREHLSSQLLGAKHHRSHGWVQSSSSQSASTSTSTSTSSTSETNVLQPDHTTPVSPAHHTDGKFYLTVQLPPDALSSHDADTTPQVSLSSISSSLASCSSQQSLDQEDSDHIQASALSFDHLHRSDATGTIDLTSSPQGAGIKSHAVQSASAASPNQHDSAEALACTDADAVSSQQQSASAAEEQADSTASLTNLWALFMLFISYVHQSASGSAVPAMLPLISPDLHLSDFQGAFLTAGYSYLYALALVPVGLLADKTSRPILLSAGLMLWSSLCMKMGQVHDFNELLMARVGFAAAQATQNPISFALIPDLFPKNKTTALAVYNCAIYLGRALSFAAVLLARSHPATPSVADQVNVQMLPLDQLDFQKTSLLYTQGNMAAVLPIYDYNYQVIEFGPVQEAAWRHLLWYIGVPGLVIAGLLAVTVREPRAKSAVSSMGTPLQDSDSESDSDAEDCVAVVPAQKQAAAVPATWSWANVLAGLGVQQVGQSGLSVAMAGQASATAPAELGLSTEVAGPNSQPTGLQLASFQLPRFDAGPLGEVWKTPAFKAVTFAAAMNDVGSYALIAWHSTFYERVFHLDPSTYAPLLASVMPIGGIIGGVGGGFLADYLDKRGGRAWVTVGASVLAAPFMAESLLAPSYQISFLALMCGFAMSEAWRSPSAIMIRSIAPSSQASTATALYICIRNLVGGMGPLAVAKLSELVGLQKAMLLAPACYLSSGLLFLVAEHMLAQKNKEQTSSA